MNDQHNTLFKYRTNWMTVKKGDVKLEECKVVKW